MNWRRLATVLVVVLVVVLGGCGFFTKTGLETGDRNEMLQPQSIVLDIGDTLDDSLNQIAKSISGFGGAFFDSDGILNIYFSKVPLPREVETVARALSVIYGDWLIPTQNNKIRVLKGQYDFSQLKKWYDHMSQTIWKIPSMVMTDIDESANRITVGIESLSGKGLIEQELNRLGIPLEAVIIEEKQRPKLLNTLRDKVRPLVAGLQATGARQCTMGPIVSRRGVRGFLVNSHCTRDMAAPDQGTWAQPTYWETERVGEELVDPTPFTGGSCPSGQRCRWSDSAFVRLDSGVPHRLGIIARAEVVDTTTLPIPPAKILGDYVIVYTIFQPVKGLRLWKVGRTTGLTWGKVERTCFNMAVRGILLLCQADVVNETGSGAYPYMRIAWGGDSGSPVFGVRPNYPHTVILYGMVWGGDPAVGSEFYFSSLNRITADLGSMIFY